MLCRKKQSIFFCCHIAVNSKTRTVKSLEIRGFQRCRVTPTRLNSNNTEKSKSFRAEKSGFMAEQIFYFYRLYEFQYQYSITKRSENQPFITLKQFFHFASKVQRHIGNIAILAITSFGKTHSVFRLML